MESFSRSTLVVTILAVMLAQTGQLFAEPNQWRQVRYQGEYEIEEELDLGFGFRVLTLLLPTSWEFGHFGFLYYRDQEICRLGNCAVSPTGDYVIFQSAITGNLALYRRADGRQAKLARGSGGVAESFEWSEDSRRVNVNYSSGVSKSYSVGPRTPWSWFL